MVLDLARIEDWLTVRALPLWGGAGWDDVHGGFFDRLTLEESGQDPEPVLEENGAPAGKRLRVQARQIYVYSHAGFLGFDSAGAERAASGFEFMTAHYWHEAGGWIFEAARDGRPKDMRRDLYEQAFALYALAWYHKVSGSDAALEWVEKTVQFLDGQKADAVHGGYWDDEIGALPRCQNPHMHLLEAWLALHGATGHGEYLSRAKAVVDLFENRFFDAATGTLGEYFAADWSPAAGAEGQIVEPGHHFEWVWLLSWFAVVAGRDMSSAAKRLDEFAMAHGVDGDGLAFDAVTRDGVVLRDDKRLWVQTEALMAAASLYETTGDMAYGLRAETIVAQLFKHYLVGGRGHWQDHIHRDGTGFMDQSPATSFYHVFAAFSETLRVFGDAPG